MNQPQFTVSFHSIKMLLTLDLNTLTRVLLDEFGTHLNVEFRPMTDTERNGVEYKIDFITGIRTRFFLLERRPDGSEMRREDLEDRIIKQGLK
jgi:hypothetical protein